MKNLLIYHRVAIFLLIASFILGGVVKYSINMSRINEPNISVTPPTDKDILSKASSESITKSTYKVITQRKVYNTWWHTALVSVDATTKKPVPVLFSKYSDVDGIRFATAPGTRLPYKTSSAGMGIPYEAIDVYNKLLDTYEEGVDG